MPFLQALDKTEVLWGEINVTLKLSRPTSSESMFLSLELCTLISCNNKGPKLNDLLIQDLTFPQFSVTLPSQKANVNLMHTHSVTLNLRKAAVFLYIYWENNIFSFYIAYLCRSSLSDLCVCARCNQNLLILPPAPFAGEGSMFCSSTYTLRKIASVENKIAFSA